MIARYRDLPPKLLTLMRQIEQQQRSNDIAHQADHVRIVIGICLRILEEVRCDAEVVLLAACLHDVSPRRDLTGTDKSAEESASFVRPILTQLGFGEERINQIANCIRTGSWEHFKRGGQPSSLEGYVLRDADLLESIGARGIARAFAFSGSHGLPFGSPFVNTDINQSDGARSVDETSFLHIYRKLLIVKDLMYSKIAKAEAEKRHAFLLSFLDQYKNEVSWEINPNTPHQE